MIVFEATGSAVSMRDGAFSTAYRYLRERPAGGFMLPAGQTCGALVQSAGHNSDASIRPAIYWRYSCGGYVIEKAREPTWLNNVGATVAQSLTVPTVTGSANRVDAP